MHLPFHIQRKHFWTNLLPELLSSWWSWQVTMQKYAPVYRCQSVIMALHCSNVPKWALLTRGIAMPTSKVATTTMWSSHENLEPGLHTYTAQTHILTPDDPKSFNMSRAMFLFLGVKRSFPSWYPSNTLQGMKKCERQMTARYFAHRVSSCVHQSVTALVANLLEAFVVKIPVTIR